MTDTNPDAAYEYNNSGDDVVQPQDKVKRCLMSRNGCDQYPWYPQNQNRCRRPCKLVFSHRGPCDCNRHPVTPRENENRAVAASTWVKFGALLSEAAESGADGV